MSINALCISSPSVRNQHYLQANSANVLNQYLYSNFTSVPNNNCIYGCVWFYLANPLSTTAPLVFAGLAENNGYGAAMQYVDLRWVSGDTYHITTGLGFTSSTEPGMSVTYSIGTTTPVTVAPFQYHKIVFLFDTNKATVTDNLIQLDNVEQTPVVKSGSPMSAIYNFSNCRIMAHGIPLNFRMASLYLGTGTMTKAEMLAANFGYKKPIWLNQLGDRPLKKPPVVYMHGTKGLIENSVNKTAFTPQGANFVSLIHTNIKGNMVSLV